jgi:hypothetical protein
VKKQEENIECGFEEQWKAPHASIPAEEVERSWKRMELLISSKTGFFRKQKWKSAVLFAAMILLLFSSALFIDIFSTDIKIHNSSLKEKEVKLPDGSLVLLKQGAGIQYHESFKNGRNVELTGEAFFDVVEDSLREFKVEKDRTKIKALKGSFLLTENRTGDLKVSVFSGRALISVKDISASFAIISGETFLSNNGKIDVKTFDTNLSFEGGNQYIDFNYIKMEKLFSLLEDRFDHQFIVDSLTNSKRVTLRINKTDSLSDILNLLSIINHSAYEIDKENNRTEVFSKK